MKKHFNYNLEWKCGQSDRDLYCPQKRLVSSTGGKE